jgi:uncharacterized protein YcnI
VRRRRRAAVVAVVVGVVLMQPGTAQAHGRLRPDRVAAGATVSTVLAVPTERSAHTSTRVAVALPPGFAATMCQAAQGWSCSTTAGGVVWERATGGPVEDFALTMRVSHQGGTYVLPVSQTYDDGEVRTFAGGPGTRDEAPVFTVTGGSAAATSPTSSTSGPAGLPAGRRLEPEPTGDSPVLVIGLLFVALTVLGVAVLAVRRNGGDARTE